MKAYRIEILAVDFDGLGADGVRSAIENARYGNDCLSPEVKVIEERDIGPWEDSHPLNNRTTADDEYKRLFKLEASTEPSSLIACANCLRPKCEHNGKLCPAPYTTHWCAWDYKTQAMPTYPEYIGTKPSSTSTSQGAAGAAEKCRCSEKVQVVQVPQASAGQPSGSAETRMGTGFAAGAGIDSGAAPGDALDATRAYNAACKMGNILFNLAQHDDMSDPWRDSARKTVKEWDEFRAAIATSTSKGPADAS